MTDQMTETQPTETPGIGHNVDENDPEGVRAGLVERHFDLIDRRDQLLASIERTPDVIKEGDEVEAGKLADFVVQLNEHLANAKAAHKAEKAPFLRDGRIVDSFLHEVNDPIEKGKARINKVRKVFADAKADKERRRLEEEARKAREEQGRIAAEAAEAAQRMQNEQDMADAIARQDEAERAAKDAEAAAKAATALPAHLGKSRGEFGGQTTLKQYPKVSDIDRATLDLDALRPYFTDEALDRAARAWAAANKDGIIAKTAKLGGAKVEMATRL